jgi:serine protease Do
MNRAIRRAVAPVVALLLACAGAAAAQAAPPLAGATPSLPDIVAPLLGAVVNISVLQRPDTAAEASEAAALIGRAKHSLGSGFIIDPAGYIVTNRHVVADGYSVTVTLDDDRQFSAQVLATNLYPDLALLKVEAGAPLPTVRFGDSNALRLGETVIAIGNPLGLSGSISVGVVSALNRNMRSTVIDDFIQTDASINHGNSGGPLFNLGGEVVGVNWALVSDTSGSIGLGLAIPANDAAAVVANMRRFGRINAGFPGMNIQALTPALADSFGISGTQGGVVTQILPGAGADKAGIRIGDVVLQIGAERTPDARAMLRQLIHFPPGSVAPVLLWRAGQTVSVDLTLTEFPPQFDPGGPPAMADRGKRVTSPPLGLRLAAMSEEARKAYRVATGQSGVVIEEVAANSAGADAGLASGDVIERVQDAPVSTPDEATDLLKKARQQGRETVPMLVRSQSRLQWMAMPLGEF